MVLDLYICNVFKILRKIQFSVLGTNNGTIIESQNYIHALPLFKFIGKYAFDEAFIDNSHDPFIIFLDLRVNKDKEVLNKLYDIIKSTCNHHLYQKFHSNIAQTNMCKL